MAGEKGATSSRALNQLQYDIANKAATITTDTADLLLVADASADYEVGKVTLGSLTLSSLDAADSDILPATDDTYALGDGTHQFTDLFITGQVYQAGNVVTTTATALSLTVTEHGGRVVLINTDSTVANTFTLPAATGSGVTFKLINNIVQTQGTVVVAADGTDVMTGKALAYDSTAVTTHAEVFLTSATSDKVTFNLTTTGGLGYDEVVATDVAAATWLVKVETTASGNCATPFSETA